MNLLSQRNNPSKSVKKTERCYARQKTRHQGIMIMHSQPERKEFKITRRIHVVPTFSLQFRHIYVMVLFPLTTPLYSLGITVKKIKS